MGLSSEVAMGRPRGSRWPEAERPSPRMMDLQSWTRIDSCHQGSGEQIVGEGKMRGLDEPQPPLPQLKKHSLCRGSRGFIQAVRVVGTVNGGWGADQRKGTGIK